MAVTKRIIHKNTDGTVTEVDIGVDAGNVSEDAEHRFMTDAERTKLAGIATGANKYTHPNGDGSKHVPATGTSSNGKFLKAGATAGAMAWSSLAKTDVGLGNVDNTSDENKPVSTAQQAALNTKVDASGGDIAATKVGSITASTASYPVPAANDTVKVGFGKIAKFFGDIKNWMTGVCLIGSIVNNCVTNNANLPLSAAQGKALMDLYTVLNAKHTELDSSFTALKGGTWNAINLNPDLYAPSSYFVWNKKGNLVTMKAYLVFLTGVNVYSSQYVNLAGLPAECRPYTSFYEPCAVDGGLQPLLCHFQTDGQIRIKSNTNKSIDGMFLNAFYLAK